jgi:hypothetical protein
MEAVGAVCIHTLPAGPLLVALQRFAMTKISQPLAPHVVVYEMRQKMNFCYGI